MYVCVYIYIYIYIPSFCKKRVQELLYVYVNLIHWVVDCRCGNNGGDGIGKPISTKQCNGCTFHYVPSVLA